MTMQASTAKKPNPKVTKAPRKPSEDNLRWFERHWGPDDGRTRLLLVGGTGPIDFRLRAAQAQARHDFTPSHWSHVALAGPSARVNRSRKVIEISLAPPGGFGHPPETNALQSGKLGRYSNAGHFPNVALFSLSVPWADVEAYVPRLQKQRSALDLVELTLTWLAHAWGVGPASNPLQQEQGIPAAVAAEALLNACGFDLSPGLTSRGSSPEAIWQGARWWHHYPGRETTREVTGAFCVGHVLGQGPKGS
ncbi:MAG: hypothetical protein IAE78_00255 [Myxococcus sp.]|nr:hypothetical protein [Myxococcus sp.]